MVLSGGVAIWEAGQNWLLQSFENWRTLETPWVHQAAQQAGAVKTYVTQQAWASFSRRMASRRTKLQAGNASHGPRTTLTGVGNSGIDIVSLPIALCCRLQAVWHADNTRYGRASLCGEQVVLMILPT